MQNLSAFFFPFADLPQPERPCRWHYGVYEYENFLHRKLNVTRYKAKLRVAYPGAFPLPAFEMQYRANLPAGAYIVRTNGEAEIYGATWTPVAAHCYSLTMPGAAWILIRVQVDANNTPALWSNAPDSVVWEVPYRGTWRKADVVMGESDCIPPHQMPPCRQEVELQRENNLWIAPYEILSDVLIQSPFKPILRVGESREEAENDDPAAFEQTTEVESIGNNLWKSIVPLAFRYIRVVNATGGTAVSAQAYITPETYRGFFTSADEELNRIWKTGAYTLHLSMQDFILDGIKRDRMPWGGDIWVGLLADCATFFDATIAQRSLSVFLAAGGTAGDVNTIIDYTLLLVISFDEYCRHFGDCEFLALRWPELKALIEKLFTRCDETGMLTKEIARIFIDWQNLKHESEVQMLWAWALESVVRLARRMNDGELAQRAGTHRNQLLPRLESQYFDAATGLYRTQAGSEPDQIYPLALAILAGLAQGERAKALCEAMKSGKYGEPGTPYAAQFILMALEKAGDVEGALTLIKRWYMPMLQAGATTFFEAGKEAPDATDYSFYGRPFGKSLCHAWAAGVTWLLPRLFTGITPLEDGFGKFKVQPPPLKLDFETRIPTPYGAIQIRQKNGEWSVTAPAECKRVDA